MPATNVFVTYCRLRDLGWKEPETWEKIDEIIGRANEREKNRAAEAALRSQKLPRGEPVQARLPIVSDPHRE